VVEVLAAALVAEVWAAAVSTAVASMEAWASMEVVASTAADSASKAFESFSLGGADAMKALFILLLLWPTVLVAQSPFDGTWVAKLDSVQFPKRPERYSLQNGTYECSTCIPRIKVKADGKNYPVAGSPYFSTIAVQIISDHSIQITEKQADRTVYSETDTVSSEGKDLVQRITDSAAANGEPVTTVETYKRVSQGPAGSGPISGSWQAEKVEASSDNGVSVTYHSIPDGLQASNPSGEGYSAKFDGRDYPIQGEPAHNTVSLKRINPNTIVETDKQDGAVHYKLRMAVSRDGRLMKVTETDNERGSQITYIMEKRSQ
jgi:hypothetical protein